MTEHDWFGFSVDVALETLRKEKAKARALRHSQWWRRQLDKGRCHYCGLAVAPERLTMDHVVPLSRGGRSTRGNLVPCCKDCNNKKKYLLPVEWESYLERLRRDGDRPADRQVDPATAAATESGQ